MTTSYSPFTQGVLERLQAQEGDVLLVKGDGFERSGALMPHHEFSDPDVVVLKLRSGYNIGVRITEASEVSIVSKSQRAERPGRQGPEPKGGRKVSVLGTGGTIASYVDYRTGAVHPALAAGDLVAAVPEIADIADVKAEVLFSIFSENMSVGRWQELAQAVADCLNGGADGVVVPHGTDTMGYTAAALSFMLDGLSGPVALVGAQRSSDRPSSDAHINLLAAARFAASSDVGEVAVLMH